MSDQTNEFAEFNAVWERHERERLDLRKKHEREAKAFLETHPEIAALLTLAADLGAEAAAVRTKVESAKGELIEALASLAKGMEKEKGGRTAAHYRSLKTRTLKLLVSYQVPPAVVEVLADLLDVKTADRVSDAAWEIVTEFAAEHPDEVSINRLGKILMTHAGGHLRTRRKEVSEKIADPRWRAHVALVRRVNALIRGLPRPG